MVGTVLDVTQYESCYARVLSDCYGKPYLGLSYSLSAANLCDGCLPRIATRNAHKVADISFQC